MNTRGQFLAGLIITLVVFGCAPQGPYRIPPPPPQPARVPPPPPPAPAPAPATPKPAAPEPPRKSLPQEGRISEQDLKSGSASVPTETTRESGKEGAAPSETLAPPLPDNSSLLAKITPGTSPQRAASLRLTDEGRKLLEAGDASRALTRLERTIVIDATNPYGYFYLAKAQFRLGRYKESLNFLDVSEARLGGDPYWLAEIHALRGENYRALGMPDKAQASYTQSLRLNSGNRTASDAMNRLQPGEAGASTRSVP